VLENGLSADGGLFTSLSRRIVYASQGEDFAEKAREEAKALQRIMAGYL